MLSEVNRLRDELKFTQNFYMERIEKIKDDSSSIFKETSVRHAIIEYFEDHPEPHTEANSMEKKLDRSCDEIQLDQNSEEEKVRSNIQTDGLNVDAEPFKPTGAKFYK